MMSAMNRDFELDLTNGVPNRDLHDCQRDGCTIRVLPSSPVERLRLYVIDGDLEGLIDYVEKET